MLAYIVLLLLMFFMVELTNSTMEGLKNSGKTVNKHPAKNTKKTLQGSDFCFKSFNQCDVRRKDCFQKMSTCLDKLDADKKGKSVADNVKKEGKKIFDKAKTVGKNLFHK